MKLYAESFFDAIPFHIETGETKHSYPEHSHDFSEIMIVFEGSGVQILEDKKHEIKSGDVFVVSGNVNHSFEHMKKNGWKERKNS